MSPFEQEWLKRASFLGDSQFVTLLFFNRLRERLIDPLQGTYYLRTLPWGALTRQWPAQYSVWQEDADADGGYRLIKTLDRCKLACMTFT